LGVAWALGAQAQEQRRVAEGRLQEALRANAALQAQLDAQTAAEAPKAAVFLQADALDAAEALMAALSEALDRPVSLGQLALHPDEGRVAVRMAADLARSQELGAVLGTIAQILARQPGAWQVQVQVGRPRGPGPSAAALGRWAAVGALAHTLDAALSARPVPWALSVDGGPPGAVRLMLQPTRPGQGGAAAQ
jgi:hypothetical protein